MLPLHFPDDETFANFYPGKNQQFLEALRICLSEAGRYLYFWSCKGAGRSHLLRAACAELTARGEAIGYLALGNRQNYFPEMLECMEHLALVCIDNIEVIAGDSVWELALFDLYNRICEQGVARLLIAGDRAPRQLNLALPDLASRLNGGRIYKLHPLSDEDKLQALKLRAHQRGFELPDDVGNFLLKRLNRDMRTLFNTLNCLDQASIIALRKLTIPFVKDVLNL